MHRQFINFITAIAFVTCATPMSFAQDFGFGGNDPLANRNSAHAGIYLKIPFTDGLKTYKKDKIKFGATLGLRRNYTSNYNANFNSFKPQRTMKLNVLDLKFNERGFKTINLVGQDMRGLKVGDVVMIDDEKGGVRWGKVALISLAVVGGAAVLLVAAMAVCDASEPGYATCIGS